MSFNSPTIPAINLHFHPTFLPSFQSPSFSSKFWFTKMTSVSSINQFSCKSIQASNLVPKIAFSQIDRINLSKQSSKKSIKLRHNFRVRVVDEDEPSASGVTFLEEESPKVMTEIDVLKKQLLDSFYGTNRGLTASSETRAEIVELITQLEAKNPTPAPCEALSLLNGKWILAYTSFLGMYPLLSRGRSLEPLVKLEEISQTIDSENFTVQNSVLFSGPLSKTEITTNAKFEVRSPKRVQIKFEEGVIGTPQLTDSIVFPENVELLGQNIDLAPFKGVLNSVQDTASSVAKTISSQPPLKFAFSNNQAESWLLTTYLDDELRISRGDGGSIFVLIKAGCPLLTP